MLSCYTTIEFRYITKKSIIPIQSGMIDLH